MLICLLFSVATYAQVGYQVSLLNSATGEPRANETVSANIEITDAMGGTVYSATQSATTNDFGVLSLVVGNANTFKNVAIGRLPLYISVTVGGTLIGKSQILSVPVAEVATTLKSDFTLDELCSKTWWSHDNPNEKSIIMTFYADGTWKYDFFNKGTRYEVRRGTYEIEGNNIYAYFIAYDGLAHHGKEIWHFRYYNSSLYLIRGEL